LQKLNKTGANLYILSNGQREFSEGELTALGIYSYIKKAYFSADYEMSKPDPQFFSSFTDKRTA
jgi:putative hydrolase of the HAD superfamily